MLSAPNALQLSSAFPPRVAVVLNGNARAVGPEVIAALGGVLRDEDIFVTRSPEQGKFIARTIVNRGYQVVVCGGGDGTFSQCVTDVVALCRPHRPPPAFGVLRLGTGNALATSLGASPPTAAGLAADLGLAADPEARRPLGMIRVEGRLAPFVGVGLDALILEDYNLVKGLLGKTGCGLGQGAAGYALAVGGRSLWRLLREPRPRILIRNQGEPAQRIDREGRSLGRPIPRGGVIYEGPVLIAAASTVPYYGLGLKLFPQAGRRPGRFQLRVADVDPFRTLLRLPALFRGELTDPGIQDFFCSAVSFQLAQPGAVQFGGDELGRRSELQLGLTQVIAVAPRASRSSSVARASRG